MAEEGQGAAPDAVRLVAEGWEGLEAREHAGYLLFPEELLVRKRDGSIERTPVMLRVPREHEIRQARNQARSQSLREGMDVDRDADLIDNLERIYLLSMAVRNATPPHEPWEPDVVALEKRYDRACLQLLYRKLDALHAYVNPQENALDANAILALMGQIAKDRHLGPLAGYAPELLRTFVLFTVDQALSFMLPKSSPASPDSSTPAASPSSDSTTS